MKRAFAYLRVSGKGQVDGDGFTRQLEAIKGYAAGHGLTIAKVYREEGVTGASEGMDRPAWVEMIGRILGNGVKTILIEKLDRLARDLMVQEHILTDLQRRGITLISVAEPDLCSDDPTRKLLRQFMGAIAEYDKAMIVLKLRGARLRMKAKRGYCEGAKPYGTFPGESAVVARMAALRASGMAFQKIAAELNAKGISPRRGARWYGKTVDNILAAQKQAA
jgi:DNA invertase Pin-like site-specific DNA recombinase